MAWPPLAIEERLGPVLVRGSTRIIPLDEEVAGWVIDLCPRTGCWRDDVTVVRAHIEENTAWGISLRVCGCGQRWTVVAIL